MDRQVASETGTRGTGSPGALLLRSDDRVAPRSPRVIDDAVTLMETGDSEMKTRSEVVFGRSSSSSTLSEPGLNSNVPPTPTPEGAISPVVVGEDSTGVTGESFGVNTSGVHGHTSSYFGNVSSNASQPCAEDAQLAVAQEEMNADRPGIVASLWEAVQNAAFVSSGTATPPARGSPYFRYQHSRYPPGGLRAAASSPPSAPRRPTPPQGTSVRPPVPKRERMRTPQEKNGSGRAVVAEEQRASGSSSSLVAPTAAVRATDGLQTKDVYEPASSEDRLSVTDQDISRAQSLFTLERWGFDMVLNSYNNLHEDTGVTVDDRSGGRTSAALPPRQEDSHSVGVAPPSRHRKERSLPEHVEDSMTNRDEGVWYERHPEHYHEMKEKHQQKFLRSATDEMRRRLSSSAQVESDNENNDEEISSSFSRMELGKIQEGASGGAVEEIEYNFARDKATREMNRLYEEQTASAGHRQSA
ncbi:unnamed protein product [Amoebophrya sp. A25]|nr:unnamed protein product [Amoebophrya sp. A25]|eukprot:GSA25T00020076001.1